MVNLDRPRTEYFGGRQVNALMVGVTVSVMVFFMLVTVWPNDSLRCAEMSNSKRIRTHVSLSAAIPCQYSVRDVAFVNVHGKSWQLQLIKPANVETKKFDQWNETLHTKLAQSNVGVVWLDAGSSQAEWLNNQIGLNHSDLPKMSLTGPGERVIPFDFAGENGQSFEEALDQLLDSPARQKILESVADALCVLILVESADRKKDALAQEACSAAIKQLNAQMWTLEKPTDQGPAFLKISAAQHSSEHWLLESLGIKNHSLPAVAIVYGQGRRLGEVLTGNDISAGKILGRASICGRDCECNLNRDWLYGVQMIHVWDRQLERAAEQSLSFDPKSAFVIAEVAQIIKKNSSNPAPDDRVDLGAGLIVHDLDPVPSSGIANENELPDPAPPRPLAEDPVPPRSSNDAPPASQNLTIPWPLMIGLLGVLVAAIAWFQLKASSQ